jgi:hypothetical protein
MGYAVIVQEGAMRTTAVVLVTALLAAAAPRGQEPSWYLKAHFDAACSCPLFCPCYFNTEPAGDRCNFNNVFTVERGHWGSIKLDGLKVWLSGNLNGNLMKGFDGVVLAFEPTASRDQVAAFTQIAGKLYMLPIAKVVNTDRTTITILHTPDKHVASRSDNMGHVELVLPKNSAQDKKSVPVVQNLQYFGAKNSGFRLYYGTHRYKGHGYDYSYTNRNGFTIDIEAGSSPVSTKTGG